MQKIRIKYFHDDMEKLTYIDGKSDWIDLRAAEDVELKAGEFKLIPLGIAMQLPKGYEAIVAPRSSTYKNFGIRQTNSIGVIDETYCGISPPVQTAIPLFMSAIVSVSFALRSTSPSCFSSRSIRWATLIEAVSGLLGRGE